MYFEDGTLVTSNDGDSPGRYGDSCFHTMAFALSHWITSPGHEYHPQVNHKRFFDDNGRTVRHRLAPWGHEDMSEDNEKPLYLFCRETSQPEEFDIREAINACSGRTGNRKLITIGYYALLHDMKWLLSITQIIQAVFFLLPYWDDGAWKTFVINMKLNWNTLTWRDWFNWMLWKFWSRLADNFPIGWLGKTDGYLMWAILAHFSYWPTRKLIRKSTLQRKIIQWYRPEIEHAINNGGNDTTGLVIDTHGLMVDQL